MRFRESGTNSATNHNQRLIIERVTRRQSGAPRAHDKMLAV